MVWPGMNQVVAISSRRSSARIRAVATMPKSPRESMVGVVSWREIALDVLSWSKVRQTKCLAMDASGLCGDMGEGASLGIEQMHGAGRRTRRHARPRLDGAVAGATQGDRRAVGKAHIDIARLAQALHRIDAAFDREESTGTRCHMLGADAQ